MGSERKGERSRGNKNKEGRGGNSVGVMRTHKKMENIRWTKTRNEWSPKRWGGWV